MWWDGLGLGDEGGGRIGVCAQSGRAYFGKRCPERDEGVLGGFFHLNIGPCPRFRS